MARADDDGSLVRLYLQQTAVEPLLTKAEEHALARAIEAGRDAERTLHNLGARADATVRAELEELSLAGECPPALRTGQPPPRCFGGTTMVTVRGSPPRLDPGGEPWSDASGGPV